MEEPAASMESRRYSWLKISSKPIIQPKRFRKSSALVGLEIIVSHLQLATGRGVTKSLTLGVDLSLTCLSSQTTSWCGFDEEAKRALTTTKAITGVVRSDSSS